MPTPNVTIVPPATIFTARLEQEPDGQQIGSVTLGQKDIYTKMYGVNSPVRDQAAYDDLLASFESLFSSAIIRAMRL